ncbi:TalC/MipB family fructose-6-phosphate aldolase [Clostridium saccharoperbutylacetonicum]|uniref:Fructose-6-phosphate aldolase Fsa n=1 Tax=Clostridium saccharoperbutylacetonicum N1-4(HMT) TaxID=931276 RepID=M1MUZ5_9CLOT|nr:fructose-6-phosphate aldolase [Clostridium saccharoperbutylacetonicum]AGF58491.1 fructose-6-phosphate aldolase Fsa [Clostridium saccharoperbutylacetonicum N1-4(HMT)]NRT60731.1 TalC/MipB family fructose-6-phosphate aldolase [Clostridium saccharoperbutylacetonicum]NSB24045.1 TalC/MipB family fructose-6-phosphate aldolase [Clostridium saccharoperbutylacetonicum]NSB43423.1 TalC/MipB family fructose-6-phosphate aldolase [Clostridium saccharoperbutylacetonicum]
MEYMLDTANIEMIKMGVEIFPIAGITSNPSIIKKEGKINFFNHFRKIREIIGIEKTLHIQVVAEDCEGILKEAKAILENIDNKVCIKIPVNAEGLKAIKILKAQGVAITATAIYTTAQGLLAMEAGADFIAPYFNRMENMNINPREVIKAFADMIEKYNYSTKILAASFKNIGQVNDSFAAGAQTATMAPEILLDALKMPAIEKAVDDFSKDWEAVFGKVSIADL